MRLSNQSIHRLYRLRSQFYKLLHSLPRNNSEYDLMNSILEFIEAEIVFLNDRIKQHDDKAMDDISDWFNQKLW